LGYGKKLGAHAAELREARNPGADRPPGYLVLAFAFDLALLAGTPRGLAYLAMNSSVMSRATGSGRWLCGDFIR
jgi:hypothetical protein